MTRRAIRGFALAAAFCSSGSALAAPDPSGCGTGASAMPLGDVASIAAAAPDKGPLLRRVLRFLYEEENVATVGRMSFVLQAPASEVQEALDQLALAGSVDTADHGYYYLTLEGRRSVDRFSAPESAPWETAAALQDPTAWRVLKRIVDDGGFSTSPLRLSYQLRLPPEQIVAALASLERADLVRPSGAGLLLTTRAIRMKLDAMLP